MKHSKASMINIQITEKKKQRSPSVFTTGSICYILIPLIFSILVTTGVSMTIITILSPYWSKLGGSHLIQDQINTLNALSVTSGNTIFELLQKVSNSRSAILLYYWENVRLKTMDSSISDRVKLIEKKYCYNLADLKPEEIYYYDTVTEESSVSLGWGIVVDSVLLRSAVFDRIQQNRFEEYIATLPMLKTSIRSDSLLQTFGYFHSIEGVYVYFPLTSAFLVKSPLEQMRNQFYISKEKYFAEMVDLEKNLLQTCVALVSAGEQFSGIFCMGVEIKGLRGAIYQVGKSQNLGFMFFSVFPTNNLNVMATNLVSNETQVEQGRLVTFLYPRLTDLLFSSNNESTQATNFLRIFGGGLIGQENFQYLLFTAEYESNQNAEIQANVFEVFQIENGVEDTLQGGDIKIKENSILIQMNLTSTEQMFTELATGIQKDAFFLIMFITIPIALVICLIASCISYQLIRAIVLPLADLQKKLSMITEDTMSIEIYSNFKPSSYELNELYRTFHRLVTVLNFANDKYFEGDDAQQLIKFSQGLKLFQEMNSLRGMGLNYNNIANIHRKAGRFTEAVKCYGDALFFCEQELFIVSGVQSLDELYPTLQRKYNATYSQQVRVSMRSNKLLIEEEIETVSKSAEKTLISHRERETAKQHLEVIYANRSFSLASAILQRETIEKGASQGSKFQDESSFRESIEHLQATLYFDERQRKNQYRQITARILLSKAHLKLGDIEQALHQISKAEEALQYYESQYEELALLNSRNVHPGILRQRMLYQEASLCQVAGQMRRAAVIYTECLETSKYYDPEIREKCLEALQDIFQKQGILGKVENVPKLLSQCRKKKGKDITFAIDFSQSMENDKKDFTIDRILKVFDQYIQLEDRVALIRFNETFESVFDLTPKSENTNYLRSAIENQKQVTPKGQSGLLQAILHSFTVFEKHTDLGHSKWLIVLSDGEDNISSISKKKMEKLVKKYSEISLIVIGVAINPDCSEELNDLCRLTKEGFFISSVESEDVDIAFQSLANLIYGSSALEYVEEQLK